MAAFVDSDLGSKNDDIHNRNDNYKVWSIDRRFTRGLGGLLVPSAR